MIDRGTRQSLQDDLDMPEETHGYGAASGHCLIDHALPGGKQGAGRGAVNANPATRASPPSASRLWKVEIPANFEWRW